MYLSSNDSNQEIDKLNLNIINDKYKNINKPISAHKLYIDTIKQ